MSLEQSYYEMLTRCDHPVFFKDFSTETTGDSPFNSILNRVAARALVRLKADFEEWKLNRYPQTATLLSIDKWEETYFGSSRTGLDLPTRIDQLMIKINRQIRMSLPDLLALAQSIIGQTPEVMRSLAVDGWVLDQSVLDVDTIFQGDPTDDNAIFTYVLIFSDPVDSTLLKQFDDELTRIEKAGSSHVILSPLQVWVLDSNTLDVDTILG